MTKCSCGAASVPGLENLHASHCRAKQSLGQKFAELHAPGIDGVFEIVKVLAPKLIEQRGPDKSPAIDIARFWEVFGPKVELGDSAGLEWCVTQCEQDNGDGSRMYAQVLGTLGHSDG